MWGIRGVQYLKYHKNKEDPMPAQQRFPTKYPGVHYIHGKWGEDKKQKIFLIRYRKNGIAIEEKVGRQREDGMTEAKASRIRAHRMSGT